MKDAGPPGASLERLQREPGAVQRRQVRACGSTPRSRRPSSPIRRSRRSPTRSASRSRPTTGLGKNANWLWAWSLAIPAGSKKADAAEKFIAWATSKDYTELVAVEGGLGQRAAGHAHLALQQPGISEGGAVREADARLDRRGRSDQADGQAGALCRRAVRRRSPSSRASARTVGQQFSAALAGSTTVDEALAAAQIVDRARDEAGRLHQVSELLPELRLPRLDCRPAACPECDRPPLSLRERRAKRWQPGRRRLLARVAADAGGRRCCSSG